MAKMNLSEAEREELMSIQRSRTMAVGQVRRAISRRLARFLLPWLPLSQYFRAMPSKKYVKHLGPGAYPVSIWSIPNPARSISERIGRFK